MSSLSLQTLATTPITTMLLYALLASALVLFVARRALGKQGKQVPRRVMIGLPIAAVLAVVLAYSIMVVQPGTTYVVTTFGSIREHRYDPGIHFVVPGSQQYPMVIRRQIFELSSLDPDAAAAAGASAVPEAQRALALSSDRIALSADLTFPYQISADLAWKVYAYISPGYESSLLIPAARAAIGQAAADFTWTDAVTSKRDELEKRIHSVFTRLVVENLTGVGFTKEEADKAFVLFAPQIRRLAPPKALLASVSERIAADVNLERQEVLNKIAEREADRRANEGLGIKKLVEQLPKEFNAVQLKDLLYALADKQRADSMLKAVERDQVKVMVMGGGGNGGTPSAVAVPTQ